VAKKAEKTPRKKFVRRGNGELIDAATLAAALDESVFTIRTLRRAGIIPCVDLGYRTKRFRLNDVLRALENRTLKVK
jgi:hypothetical protein